MQAVAALGHFDHVHIGDRRPVAPQQPLTQTVDGQALRATREPDGHGVPAQVDDISAFQVERAVVAEPLGRVREARVMLRDGLEQVYLAVAVVPVHMVETDAAADHA